MNFVNTNSSDFLPIFNKTDVYSTFDWFAINYHFPSPVEIDFTLKVKELTISPVQLKKHMK